MKKNVLISLTFIPLVTGYMLNQSLMLPRLGLLFYYLIPFVTLPFWFYLGRKYSETNWNIMQSTAMGNGIGFLSLLIFFWQFWWQDDNSMNLFLASMSQLFVASTNILTARVAPLFEIEKNTFTSISFTAMQILGLLLMVIIFISGYVFGKAKSKIKV